MATATDQICRIGLAIFVLEEPADPPLNEVPRFLAGKRDTGKLALPGGNLDVTKSLEQCAVQLALEQTGLEVTAVRATTSMEDVDAEMDQSYSTIFVVALPLSKWNESKLMERGWEWTEWTDLVELIEQDEEAVSTSLRTMVKVKKHKAPTHGVKYLST